MARKRRKARWVLSKFQRWFIITFCLYSAVFVALIAAGIAAWYGLVAQQYFEMAQVLSPTFIQQVHQSLRVGLLYLVGMSIAHLGVAFFFAFQFSRRLAGPIYAVIRHLRQYTHTGQWKPIQLRSGDCFIELADELNLAIDQSGTQKDKSEAA